MSERAMEKPCNMCSTEMRDHCWKGRAFACEDWYVWNKSVACDEGRTN